MDKSLCPICLQPKSDSTENSGSLTQWVSGCRCSRIKEEEDLFLSLRLCARCHKRINLARHGSFTQWIFRTDLCSCDQPKLEESINTSPGEIEQEVLDYPEMEELAVDFPLDRFKPIEELGRGAGSIVFRCQDRLLGKIVAIKVLTDPDPVAVIAFQEEARLISRLSHENIIEIVDIGITDKGTPYLVLEYILGLDLHTLISDKGAFPWMEVVDLGIQICTAMDYAHKEGIYHRDLKPANILISGDAESSMSVKIIDFGIAAAPRNRLEYQGETLAGTPAYMSPDQAQGYPFDSRSEIYSVACLLYEALTGNVPYMGDSSLEILQQKLMYSPPNIVSPPELPEIPETLKAIVTKGLNREREERFSDFSELKEQLESCFYSSNIQEVSEPVSEYSINSRIDSTQKATTDSSPRIAQLIGAGIFVLAIASLFAFHRIANQSKDHSKNGADGRKEASAAKFTDISVGESEDNMALGYFEKGKEDGELIALGVITEKTLSQLDDRKNVKKLQLARVWLDGRGLKKLAQLDLPLQSLNISENLIDDKDLQALKAFKHLREIKSLNVSGTAVRGENLDMFENLEELSIAGKSISKEGLEKISKMNKLKNLFFSGNRSMTKGDIEKLSANLNLEHLGIQGNELSAEALMPFSRMSNLRSLIFNGRTITEADLKFIAASQISELQIWKGRKVTDGALAAIPSLVGLKKLIISQKVLNEMQTSKLKNNLPSNTDLEIRKRKKR